VYSDSSGECQARKRRLKAEGLAVQCGCEPGEGGVLYAGYKVLAKESRANTKAKRAKQWAGWQDFRD
jgi:hypothetical protein